jgi:hypothetical protein
MYTQQREVDGGGQVLYFRHAPPVLSRALFLETYPLKRPQPPHRNAKAWQCSIYYFWWRFLCENEGFRNQQAVSGSAEAIVQRDFDLALKLNFPNWWIAQGRFLFCEPEADEVRFVNDMDDELSRTDRLVVSIPLGGDIERHLSKIRAMYGSGSSKNHSKERSSRARYPVAATMPLNALYKCYNIWRVRRDNPELKLHEVAHYGGLLPNGPMDSPDVKRTLAAAASRYIREAVSIIDYVGRGQFPVKGPAQSDWAIDHLTMPEPEPVYVDPEEMAEWIKSIHRNEPELVHKYMGTVLPMLRKAWEDKE